MLGQRIVGYAAGAILFAAVWMMCPPAGMFCVAVVTAELLLRIALWVRQVFVNRQLRFQSLSQNEQALRRGSQGFALMVFAVLAFIVPRMWWQGWPHVAGLVLPVLSLPVGTVSLLVCLASFIAGAVRFFDGASRSAGTRDPTGRFKAAVCCALGVAALVYLTRADVFGRYSASPVLLGFSAAVFLISVWVALSALVRVGLLSMPRGAARAAVARRNRHTKFFWPGERRFLFWRW
jgi:hypothetical protein